MKTTSGKLIVEKKTLEPVVEEPEDWDLFDAHNTPVPVTSRESESDSAPEVEACEYC